MAANNSAPMPKTVARIPAAGRLAPASIASTAVAPASPSISLIDDMTWEATAPCPNSSPATAMTITMIGPTENTE
jgi:hypothetical protein